MQYDITIPILGPTIIMVLDILLLSIVYFSRKRLVRINRVYPLIAAICLIIIINGWFEIDAGIIRANISYEEYIPGVEYHPPSTISFGVFLSFGLILLAFFLPVLLKKMKDDQLMENLPENDIG